MNFWIFQILITLWDDAVDGDNDDADDKCKGLILKVFNNDVYGVDSEKMIRILIEPFFL